MTTTKEVSDALGGNNALLTITEDTNYLIVTPKEYITDRTIFSEIGRIMHNFNAEFIRGDKKAGVTTHWRVLKTQANSKLQNEGNHIQLAMDYLAMALDELRQAGYGKPST